MHTQKIAFMQKLVWQVYLDGNLPASVNMARDEYLLQIASKQQKGFIRLYGWNATTLSLGRNQHPARDINLKACSQRQVPLIRRITGGRTVIHGQDLTYAIAAPNNIFSPHKRVRLLDIYQAISQVFSYFFQSLNISTEFQTYSPQQQAQLASPICFATPAAFELLHQGKKLLGSAQRLLPKAFLQHGSLPLYPQDELIKLLFLSPEKEMIHHKMTDLSSVSSPQIAKNIPHIQQLLLQSFKEVWGIHPQLSQWQPQQQQAIQPLLANYPLLDPSTILPR